MRNGKLKKGLAVAMVVGMVGLLFSGCGQQPKQEAAPANPEQAYEAFIQDQKEAAKTDKIYAVVTTTSEDGAPVLLIATEEPGFENQVIKADIYSFADGQVVKIGEIESTGTAYPIGSVDGKYLVAGSHHTVKRYLVSGDKAYAEILDGYAMEEPNCKITTFIVTNDEISDAEEKDVDEAAADEFATAIYEGWEPISFLEY